MSRLRGKLTGPRGAAIILASCVATLVALVASPGGPHGCASADATNPFSAGSYCWFLDVEVTNNTGSDVTDFVARGEVNAAGFITDNILDPLAWTLYGQQGSFQNGQNIEAQDLSETDAQWWIQMGDIPNGETRITRIYMKNAAQQRDQAIHFSGREQLNIPNDVAFNLDDHEAVVVAITNHDETARTETIVDKYVNSGFQGGYHIFWNDNGGNLELAVEFNGDSSTQVVKCEVAWNTAWTGERILVTLLADKNGSGVFDIFFWIFSPVAPMSGNQCIEDPHVSQDVFQNTEDVIIGQNNGGRPASVAPDPLSGTDVHWIEWWDGVPLGTWTAANIRDAGDREALYLFDPTTMAESTSVDPTYTGTLDETLGLGPPQATYTFTRSQTGMAVSTGIPALVSGASPATLPSSLTAVSGTPLDADFTTTGSENTNLLFYSFFNQTVNSIRWGRQAMWSLIALLPALMLGSLMFALFRTAISFIVGAGLPYAYAVSGELISEWFLLVWGLAAAGAIGWQQWQRQS